MKLFFIILKNMARNKVRSLLTVVAIFLLVAIFTMIETVVGFLDDQMKEQSKDVMVVITDRYKVPSTFDVKYMEDVAGTGSTINSNLTPIPGFHAEQTNVWSFVLFTLDPALKEQDKIFMTFATWPEKIGTMTDGLKGFDADGKLAEKMKHPPVSGVDNIGIILGPERLGKIGKKIGDVFTAQTILHKGSDGKPIEMQFEVVGELPAISRWTNLGFMDVTYFNRVLKAVGSAMDGKVNLGWIMADSQEAAMQSTGVIESFVPDLKCEPLSSAVGRFLEPYKNILFGVKYLLIPAIWFVMIAIIANSISISVRERRMEIAVLKVLGFSPGQIMTLILGEGVLLGALAGGLSAFVVWATLNNFKFQVAFFGGFIVKDEAILWGFGLGAVAALLGSFFPAWGARNVKVVDVFSKVV